MELRDPPHDAGQSLLRGNKYKMLTIELLLFRRNYDILALWKTSLQVFNIFPVEDLALNDEILGGLN